VTGAAAEGDGSSGGTGEERATTAGSESGSGSTAAGVVDTAAVEALDLLLRVVAAFSAHVKSSAATADRALHLSGGLPALQHMLATEAGRSLPPPHRCDDDAAELTRVAALCTASGSCPSPQRACHYGVNHLDLPACVWLWVWPGVFVPAWADDKSLEVATAAVSALISWFTTVIGVVNKAAVAQKASEASQLLDLQAEVAELRSVVSRRAAAWIVDGFPSAWCSPHPLSVVH
jgi:hypothetical protein